MNKYILELYIIYLYEIFACSTTKSYKDLNNMPTKIHLNIINHCRLTTSINLCESNIIDYCCVALQPDQRTNALIKEHCCKMWIA